MNNQTPPYAGTAFDKMAYLSGAEAKGQQVTAVSGKNGVEECVTSV